MCRWLYPLILQNLIIPQLVLGVEQVVVAEAMLLGQKLGLDPAILTSVISSSTGSCWSISVNNPVPKALAEKSPPCERDYEGGFATSLMLKVSRILNLISFLIPLPKDMRLATDAASQQGVPLSLGSAAQDMYAEVVENDPQLSKKDFSSVYKYLSSKLSK